MTPEEILKQTRQLIEEHGASDPDKWWYTNRYVFARLQLDERKLKTAIKRRVFDANKPCHYCGKSFETTRNVHLHRLDANKGYSDANCVLMHAECHQQYHAEREPEDASVPEAAAALIKQSKRYEGMPFLYWWDIWPSLADSLDRFDVVEFVKKDSGERCIVPPADLTGFLTPDRQTTRGAGNWGIKVLNDHQDKLGFEPGIGRGDWLFLPVVWINEQEED